MGAYVAAPATRRRTQQTRGIDEHDSRQQETHRRGGRERDNREAESCAPCRPMASSGCAL